MEVCWLSVIDYHTQDLTQAPGDDCLGHGWRIITAGDTGWHQTLAGHQDRDGLHQTPDLSSVRPTLYSTALILPPIDCGLICRFSIWAWLQLLTGRLCFRLETIPTANNEQLQESAGWAKTKESLQILAFNLIKSSWFTVQSSSHLQIIFDHLSIPFKVNK